jgi:predicted PurR-regulated permease PerM
MNLQKFTTAFFLICFAAIAYGLYLIFKPFFVPIIWAVILSTTFYAWYERLCAKLRGRRGLGAFVMLVLLLMLLILPMLWILFMLAQQSVDLYHYLQTQVGNASDLKTSISGSKLFVDMLEWLGRWIDLGQVDLEAQMLKGLQFISSFLVEQSSNILGGLLSFIMDFLIMMVTMYYLFKDGPSIYKAIKEISPLSDEYEDMVVNQFRDVSQATLYGNVMTALSQGVAGSILFWSVGLSGSLLWGALMALLSFVPMVGSFLVWGPAGLYLLITGHVTKAMVVWIGGGVAVASLDNILKPMFIKGKADMHALLIFFSVFGGMGAFGFLGLVLGPLVVALFLTFLNLYRVEFKEVLAHKDLRENSRTMMPE